jgi:3',5'-cyclic AMP phosphodiesterase CpdA
MPALLPQVLVHLSDTHITVPGRLLDGRVDTATSLARAVDAVRRLRPRPVAVLISGDLVDAGSPAEYAHLRTLLADLPGPVYLMPGNHDERGALRAAFADHAYLGPMDEGEFIQYAVDLPGLRLVALDTVVPGAGHGALCERRLDWLDATLAEAPRQPTLVALHHPPFLTHIAHMDALGLREGREDFEAIIRRHPQVERIACGHLHRCIQARIAHTVAITVPSTAHQVALDLVGDHPASYTFEPPGVGLHVWTTGTDLVSHVMPIGDYPGPFAY